MTRKYIEWSLALWRRRLASRRVKLARAQTALTAALGAAQPQFKVPAARRRVARYERLKDEALVNVARRKKQLAVLPITKVGAKGVTLIKSFEGYVNGGRPYLDTIASPPVWTIGYGHIEGVTANSKRLTEKQAADLLARDLDRKYAPYVAALKLPLTQDQFDALVSFVYNVGPGGIAASTKVGRALRARAWRTAADHLVDWDRAGGRVVPGLTRRRRAERNLFLTGRLDL